ncbi:hypothetical protein BGZ46_008015 [Entomortierella lignicola]|nr:hypothetical protein BGZ46_008015 [Entomortierella lignicola]
MKFTSIISLTAALGIVSATTAELHHSDPCALFGAQALNPNATITVKTVRDCYNAQKFDHEVAKTTIESLESLFDNFYVFKDVAKMKTGYPFETPQVDVIRGLKKIASKKWKNDFDFQMAIYYHVSTLNDAHVSYSVNCYQSVGFLQSLFLYAPVIDGKQSVRVLGVNTDVPGAPTKDINDCEVTEIDGIPALRAIEMRNDLNYGISKDPGVRLNDAMATMSWSPQGWGTYYGAFTYRFIPPTKDAVEYTLKCGKYTEKIKVPWFVTNLSSALSSQPFNSTETFWKTQCLASSQAPGESDNGVRQGLRYTPSKTLIKKPKVTKKTLGDEKDASIGPTTKARQVFSTLTTGFFTLHDSDSCVLTLSTEEFNYDISEYRNFIKGVEILRKAGCKKLIFDVSNNGGGLIDFAYFINALFFPDADYFFQQDMRANAYVQGASKIAVKESAVGDNMFDPRGYFKPNYQAFTDDSMFLKGKKYTRGGVTEPYTQRNFFGGGWSPLLPLNKTLSWTAKDMAIVSNGYCGSACTMVAGRFKIAHGVKTYAIGGIHKRALSFITFPGGVVIQDSDFVQQIQNLTYTAKGGPINTPLSSYASVPWSETYAEPTSTIPLEYDYKRFPADVHLDQSPVYARHPDQVWLKVAADFKH